MTGRRRLTVLTLILVVGTGAALVHELTRSRAPLARPVTSPLPLRSDETERLEGGFRWTATRAGRLLFELDGRSMVRIGGGLQLLRGVERLGLSLEDGRVVEVSADRGSVEQGRGEGESSRVRLEGSVRIRDPDGTVLETDAVEYDSEAGTLACIGPTRVVGETIDANVGSLVYRPDTRLIEGLDDLELLVGAGEPWLIDTRGASYRMTTGELVFDQPFRARQGTRVLISGPGLLRPEREGQPAEFASSEGAMIVERARDESIELVSAGLVATAGGDGGLSAFEAAGPASMVLERTGAGADRETVRIASGGWRLDPAGGQEMSPLVSAGPGFVLVTDSEEGEMRVTGRWLDAERSDERAVGRVTGRLDIRFSGPQEIEASGESFAWESGVPDRLVLSGAPARASKRGDTVEAPEIVIERERRVVVARGGAVAELYSIGDDPGSLFRADEPVRVSSQSVTIPQRDGDIVFEGPVQAWQGASTLRSQALRFGVRTRQLTAEREFDLTVDRVGEGGVSSRTRLRGERLDYSVPTRIADVAGPARYEQPGVALDATLMRVHFGDNSEVERLVATGDVRLRTTEAKGRADRLIWEGGAKGTVWLVGERDVAVLEFVDRGQAGALRVGRLRYDLGTGQAFVESGPGRGTLETAPNSGDAARQPRESGRGEER